MINHFLIKHKEKTAEIDTGNTGKYHSVYTYSFR